MNTANLSTINDLEQEAANNDRATDPTGRDIMLYDGVCNYCLNTVKAAIEHDVNNKFLYSPLQSVFARKALERYGINALELKSVYIISEYNTSNEHLRSAAPGANYLLQNLSGDMKQHGERNARKPRNVQDDEYNDLSDNRYTRFGKYDTVIIPVENREKFIF